jgi:ubiquinone/menaquinone biosynthesis C-methylase UbiE
MPNNYNKIAKHYDFISRLVFGKSIVKAQASLLQFIPANSSMLIVGGGTGWILEEISKVHSQGLTITYVEISSQMIGLARKRNCGNNKIYFTNQPVETYISNNKFDIIMTPFLFDNFGDEKIQIIFSKLNQLLKNQGRWLFADFVNEKNKEIIWQKFLLKTMYLFFRITCNIETQKLIDMEIYFEKEYSKIFEARFYAGFIKAIVYQKDIY